MCLLGEGKTCLTLAKSDDDVVLGGDLGLNVVRKVVGIVAREDDTSRHGVERFGRVHLLDVALVVGVNDSRDVEVSLALPASELHLAEHTRRVLLAISDGVEVANILLGELNSGLLAAADNDGVGTVDVVIGGEVDGTLDIIKSPEGDGAGASESGRASKGKDGRGEMHLE